MGVMEQWISDDDIQEFENKLYDADDKDEEDFNSTKKHHEDTLSFQKRLFEDATKQ